LQRKTIVVCAKSHTAHYSNNRVAIAVGVSIGLFALIVIVAVVTVLLLRSRKRHVEVVGDSGMNNVNDSGASLDGSEPVDFL
jgi:hypothetical protein